jgi:hypothetical protein
VPSAQNWHIDPHCLGQSKSTVGGGKEVDFSTLVQGVAKPFAEVCGCHLGRKVTLPQPSLLVLQASASVSCWRKCKTVSIGNR